jgi:hypothetical protein
MSLHPGHHLRDEQQVVSAAERMEVQSPLRNDDRLSLGLRECRHPVEAAGLGGEDLHPLGLMVKRA